MPIAWLEGVLPDEKLGCSLLLSRERCSIRCPISASRKYSESRSPETRKQLCCSRLRQANEQRLAAGKRDTGKVARAINVLGTKENHLDLPSLECAQRWNLRALRR